MPTTALLVEIVIVGFGFFISFLPILSLVFGVDPKTIAQFYYDVPLQFQLVAAYPAGIIWNRVCDQIFGWLDNRLLTALFKSKEEFHSARVEVVMQGEAIRDYIGNFRSLIRINRALNVLLLIYIICTPILFWGHGSIVIPLGGNIAVLIFVFEILLLAISIYAWFRLVRGYASAVHDAYKVIKKKEQREDRKEKK